MIFLIYQYVTYVYSRSLGFLKIRYVLDWDDLDKIIILQGLFIHPVYLKGEHLQIKVALSWEFYQKRTANQNNFVCYFVLFFFRHDHVSKHADIDPFLLLNTQTTRRSLKNSNFL